MKFEYFSPNDTIKSRLILIAIPIFMLIICLFTFHTAKNAYEEAEATKSWLSTKGEITLSEIQEYRYKDSNKKEQTGISPYISFKYEISEKEYYSDNIWMGFPPRDFDDKKKRELIESYPEGKIVDIYYNPDKIEQAVLFSGNFNDNPYYLSIYIALSSLSFILLYGFIRGHNSKKSEESGLR